MELTNDLKIKVAKIFIPEDSIYEEYVSKMEQNLQFKKDITEILNNISDMCSNGINTNDIKYYTTISNIITSFSLQNNLEIEKLKNLNMED